jgi:hypothetical protein
VVSLNAISGKKSWYRTPSVCYLYMGLFTFERLSVPNFQRLVKTDQP